MGRVIENCLLFLVLFNILSLPVFISYEPPEKLAVILQKPEASRGLASTKEAVKAQCERQQRWRSRCHRNSQNERVCQKDQKQTYWDCTQ